MNRAVRFARIAFFVLVARLGLAAGDSTVPTAPKPAADAGGTASVTVILHPPNQQWGLDGDTYMPTGTTLARVTPGAHTVTVSNGSPGEKIVLAPGEHKTLEIGHETVVKPVDPHELLLFDAKTGDFDELKHLVGTGADLYWSDAHGRSVLGAAIEGKKPEIVNWLLGDAHFDVLRVVTGPQHVAIQAGATALSAAAAQGDESSVRRLLELGVTPDLGRHGPLEQPIEAAFDHHQRGTLLQLLRAGANYQFLVIPRGERSGRAFLSWVVTQHDREILKLLIEERHVSADAEELYGGELLIADAAKRGWFEGVDYLMAYGADPYKMGPHGSALSQAKDPAIVTRMLEGALARLDDGAEATQAGIALFLAIDANDRDRFVRALAVKGATQFRNPIGNTPLIFAIGRKQGAMALELIQADPECDYVNEGGMTPLAVACSLRLDDVAAALINGGADLELAEEDAFTPLGFAAREGDLKLVKLLLAKGANVDSRTGRGVDELKPTPLMLAAQNGWLDIVNALLAAGANPNAVDSRRWSVLMFAALSDQPAILQRLLDAGADRNYALGDTEGTNAASIAINNYKLNSLKFLTEVGVRNEITASRMANRPYGITRNREVDEYLRTHYRPETQEGAFWAARHSLAEVKAFVERGGDVNFAADQTPLQRAIDNRQFDIAKYLLEHGANPSLVGSSAPETPLQLCFPPVHDAETDRQLKEIVMLLLEKGADIDTVGLPNSVIMVQPALMHALQAHYPELFAFLLEKGADPTFGTGSAAVIFSVINRSENYTPLEKADLRALVEKAIAARPKPPSSEAPVPDAEARKRQASHGA